MGFYERVWEKCRNVPKGKVTTYSDIAHALGSKAYRAVGTALKKNPYAPSVPCHRVVKSDGRVGGFKGKMDNTQKIRMLKREGIGIKDGKIIEFKKMRFSLI